MFFKIESWNFQHKFQLIQTIGIFIFSISCKCQNHKNVNWPNFQWRFWSKQAAKVVSDNMITVFWLICRPQINGGSFNRIGHVTRSAPYKNSTKPDGRTADRSYTLKSSIREKKVGQKKLLYLLSMCVCILPAVY